MTDQNSDQESNQKGDQKTSGAGVLSCPVHVDEVDLFARGAQEFWYEAYDLLHADSPVHRMPGEGMVPGSDAFVLTKHDDIAAVVRDQDRFPLPSSAFVRQLVETARGYAGRTCQERHRREGWANWPDCARCGRSYDG